MGDFGIIKDPPYTDEATAAAATKGYEFVEATGISDYQGWGVALFKRALPPDSMHGDWAIMAWSYGSCGGCCSYADESFETNVEAFKELLEECATEEVARALYDSRKGW